jgi:hypothetical protein
LGRKTDTTEEKTALEQFTEFVDVLGKYGVPFTLVVLGFLVIYWSLFTGQSIAVSPNNAVGTIIGTAMIFFGAYIEYKKTVIAEPKESIRKVR